MRSIASNIINGIESIYESNTFLILQTPFHPKPDDNSSQVTKLTEPAQIAEIYIDTGRDDAKLHQRIKSRLDHGLDFFVYKIDNEIVATTWMLYNKPRFVDEIAIHFGPVADSLWVRDVYVIKQQRGKGYFSKAINKIAIDHYPAGITQILSDVQSSNEKSVRAHKKYGFNTVSRIHYFVLFRKFLIRRVTLSGMNYRAYKENSTVLVRDQDFVTHLKQFMA